MTLSCLNHVKRNNETKERPAPPSHTDSVGIFDRSGSMECAGSSLKEGAKSWLESQMNLSKSGGQQWVVLIIFDDIANTIFEGWAHTLTPELINDLAESVFPRGCTRLYDTAGEAIKEQQKRIQERESNFTETEKKLGLKIKATYTLMTDGADNSSVSYNRLRLFEAITSHRKRGVFCQFLAANMDARVTGQLYGFHDNNSLQVDADPHHFRSAFMAATSSAEKACMGLPPTATRFSNLMRAQSSSSAAYYTHPPLNTPAYPVMGLNMPPPPRPRGFLTTI